MPFDRWTYKQKNKMLLVAAVMLALISWIFSFSKTYTQIREYRQLSGIQQQSLGAFSDSGLLDQKEAKLDSLINQFTIDSVAFEDSFLQNISLALQELPVKVSYDGSKSSNGNTGTVLHKEIILEGKYKDIVRALQKLEKVYYVNRCRVTEEGRCVVEVGVQTAKFMVR